MTSLTLRSKIFDVDVKSDVTTFDTPVHAFLRSNLFESPEQLFSLSLLILLSPIKVFHNRCLLLVLKVCS